MCDIKLGTSNPLMLVSEYHRPLTCTPHSESDEVALAEVCFFQAEDSQCLSFCWETQTGERESLTFFGWFCHVESP